MPSTCLFSSNETSSNHPALEHRYRGTIGRANWKNGKDRKPFDCITSHTTTRQKSFVTNTRSIETVPQTWHFSISHEREEQREHQHPLWPPHTFCSFVPSNLRIIREHEKRETPTVRPIAHHCPENSRLPLCLGNKEKRKKEHGTPIQIRRSKRRKIKEIRNRALEWQVEVKVLIWLPIVLRRRAVGLSILIRIMTAMQMRCCFVVVDAKLISTLDAGMALADRCYAVRKVHAVVGERDDRTS